MKTAPIAVITRWALSPALVLALLVSVGTSGNIGVADGREAMNGQPATTASRQDSPVPICVDKTSIFFDEANVRKGDLVHVDNTSGLDLAVGIELPQQGLTYKQLIRKPEQIKVPRDSWDRFIVPPNSGILIILIPETYPEQLAMLDGKHIVIKVYQGNEARVTLRIPIKVAADLKPQARGPSTGSPALSGKEKEKVPPRTEAPRGTPQQEAWRCPPQLATGLGAGSRAAAQALIEAAKQGDVRQVKELLADRGDVNSKDRYGRTALMEAAERGELRVVKALLAKGADVNEKDRDGLTALIAAAGEGRFKVVRLLLNKGAQVNEKTKDGPTPLMAAAFKGHLEVVKQLLEKGAHVNTRCRRGGTALIIAAQVGRLETAKLLLDKGADVNVKAKDGATPLWKAALYGHLEVVKLLLEQGADVNARCWRGGTALTIAALVSQLEVVQLLLHKGADVNARDKSGRTPLMGAAQDGRLKMMELLLDFEADVNAKEKSGRTALMFAVNRGRLEVAKVLLEKGANVNAKDKGGWTALMSGAERGNREVLNLLLEKGADVNAKSTAPFRSKRARGSSRVYSGAAAEFLKLPGESGWTALMSGAAEGHVDVVKALLHKGADVNAQTRFDWTALKIARMKGDRRMEELLKAHGAKE